MSFYERYEALCREHNFSPNSAKSFEISGVSTGTISSWKRNVLPKCDALCRIAEYFHVSTDYLLGLSDKNTGGAMELSEHEALLLEAFRSADAEGQQNIIFACQLELRKASEKSAETAV